MSNPFKKYVIEYHILQSFPVTCLNRDDVGSPKSAIVGGTNRARVSSQCWKRQVRMQLHELGVKIAIRSKKISELIAKECQKIGANEEQAKGCGTVLANEIAKDTLFFFTEKEATAYANYLKSLNFNAESIKKADISKISKSVIIKAVDGLDLALFGRMVASEADMNIEAAAAFSHAISTHKVNNEVEFFTALDDFAENQASAHMGIMEFNSAIYYRYISLNLGQLFDNIGGDDIEQAAEAFTKALYLAIPEAKQATMSGSSFWDYAKIFVRKGQRLQIPFDEAIKGTNLMKESKNAMEKYLKNKEQQAGSLFGKIAEYEISDDGNLSIDDLVNNLKTDIGKIK